jgi:colicin import membrane protein
MDARPSALHAATAERPEFAPPEEGQIWRSLALAVFAHVLLVVALTYGLHWQRESENVAVEAELWSALPQEAAPKPVPAPPPPPPAPAPVVKAPPAPEPPAKKDADIAIEREKQRRELEKQREAELARERITEQRKLAAEKKHQEELAKRREEQQEAKLREQEKRKEDEKKRKLQEAKAAQDAKLREQARQDQIRRSLAMAGTGSPSSNGTAAHSSGPSAGWGAKVQARVRPNIVFTEAAEGNPKAEVEVRCSPDGTIVGKRLVHSSGNKAWDEAVLRALDRTESLPRDVDGRVPSPVIIGFKPHN